MIIAQLILYLVKTYPGNNPAYQAKYKKCYRQGRGNCEGASDQRDNLLRPLKVGQNRK